MQRRAVRPQGSSPRMRGARLRGRHHRLPGGIIPAYAGSTPLRCIRKETDWDHPRVCGEHSTFWTWTAAGSGSSPRMRGAPHKMWFLLLWRGIIPAYAGSTSRYTLKPKLTRDHPRVCGEHEPPHPRGFRRGGSSPRMRGARLQARRARGRVGIIPAYAGSTFTWTYAPN